jgi:hypothetical protein
MDSAVLVDFVFDDDEVMELQAILVGVVILGPQVRIQKNRIPDPHDSTYAAPNTSQTLMSS